MEEDKLIKLVCPTYKQYLKSLVLCIFIYIIFNTSNGLIIAISIAMIINLLSSMIESSRWLRLINNNEYSLEYATVTSFMYSAVITNYSNDYCLSFTDNLHIGDEVMLLVFKDEYLVIKKI